MAERVHALKRQHGKELQQLKRQLGARQPYDIVVQRAAILRLRRDLEKSRSGRGTTRKVLLRG